MSTIIINNESVRLRPSSVDSFYGCAYQWGKTYLEGGSSIVNSRAAIGTGIHAGIEKSWVEAIQAGKADHNLTMMTDAAIDCFREETKEGFTKNNDETTDTCEKEIVGGLKAWVEDAAPFLQVPTGVEEFFKVNIDNPIVTELGGTVDYIGHGIIDDVKTSKRMVTGSSYDTQQAIYKYLAEENGHEIKHSRLQVVVLKKTPEAAILNIDPNVEQAKVAINGILNTMDLIAKDVAPIELILRGNPKHMFCSDKFCAFHNDCPWVKGRIVEKELITKVRL